jgi:hypothetical protein
MSTYKGAYSPDPEFKTTCDDLAWMPGPTAKEARSGTYVRDNQPRIRKGSVVDDRDGGGFSGPVSRSRNHP